MKNNKALDPSGITLEMLKALDEDCIEWLYIILNKFLQREQLPDDIKQSEIRTYINKKAMKWNVETIGASSWTFVDREKAFIAFCSLLEPAQRGILEKIIMSSDPCTKGQEQELEVARVSRRVLK